AIASIEHHQLHCRLSFSVRRSSPRYRRAYAGLPTRDASATNHIRPAPMGEMEILGDTVAGGISRHRRDYHAVFEGDVLDRDRAEKKRLHGGRGGLGDDER